jgi:hypothetical protein
MKFPHLFVRLGLAAALLGSLAACTVVPVHPAAYRGPPVVVDSYPGYRYGYPSTFYYGNRDHRHGGDRGGRQYRDDRRRYDSPLDSAARSHRNIRRGLGLPRLPGMP